MKSLSILTLVLLVAGCVSTGSSGINAVCGLELPSVSPQDTDLTQIELDNFSERFRAACSR